MGGVVVYRSNLVSNISISGGAGVDVHVVLRPSRAHRSISTRHARPAPGQSEQQARKTSIEPEIVSSMRSMESNIS